MAVKTKPTHYEFFVGTAPIPLDIELISKMAPETICGCSTCKQTFDMALRDSKEMMKVICPASLLQYGLFIQMLAKAIVSSARHEHNPYASAKDILKASMAACDDVENATAAVGIKYTEQLYEASEPIALDYFKRTL